MNPVLIGLSPGKLRCQPLGPSGGTGAHLSTLLGIPDEVEYLTRIDRINFYPTAGKVAREDVEQHFWNLISIVRGRRVVTLGGEVSQWFTDLDLFDWQVKEGCVVAAAPHPSGMNRWWNDPKNAAAAKRFFRRLMKPCIHIEGPDGSGKTTLAVDLAKRMKLRLIPTDDPPKNWGECLRRVEKRIVPGIVCDRSSGLVSELVYGPVLRGGTIAPESWFWGRVRSVLHAVVFIYCRPIALNMGFRSGEDPDHIRGVQKNIAKILARYDEVMARISSMGARVLYYDRDSLSLEQVIRCVES